MNEISIMNLTGQDPNKVPENKEKPTQESKDPKNSKDSQGSKEPESAQGQPSPQNQQNPQGPQSPQGPQGPQNIPGPQPPMKPKKSQKPFYKKASFWIWTALIVFLFMLIFGVFSGEQVMIVGPHWVLDTNLDGKTGTGLITDIYIYDYPNSGYSIIVFVSEQGNHYQWTVDTIFDKAVWFYVTGNPGHWVGPLSPTIHAVDTTPSFFWSLFFALLPWVIIFGFGFWLMRMMIKKQTQTGNMGKKQLTPQMSNVRFSDVAGYQEVKDELEEIVDFLKNPMKYSSVGARTPKGVLMSGAPGTGKTYFAKAVAGEAGIPFFSISGSDFVEMFVGVGASRVRSLFAQAKSMAPALIFIDELDAVGRQRGAGMGGGNDEREQTLNQLLVEMDGFQANTGIVIIAATNRPDVLDPAIRRPGRFDRSIELRLPDVIERQAILEIYANKGNKHFTPDINWAKLAMRTPGFSPAQLENVINEAAILSVRLKKEAISLSIIDEAIDRVIAGPSRSNRVISPEEKEMIAYHESGHALLGLVLPKAEKVQKITIIPRGDAGGYVLMTPKKEKFVQTKSELEAKIISYLGGRAAEEIFYGEDEISTGAFSDIEAATSIARKMVAEFGMSDLGPIQYEKDTGNVFLGRDFSKNKDFSDSVAHEIDQEVRKLIKGAYAKAYEIIDANKDLMDLFAKALLIKETLTAEESEFIYANRKLPQLVLDIEIKEKEATKAQKAAAKKLADDLAKGIKPELPKEDVKDCMQSLQTLAGKVEDKSKKLADLDGLNVKTLAYLNTKKIETLNDLIILTEDQIRTLIDNSSVDALSFAQKKVQFISFINQIQALIDIANLPSKKWMLPKRDKKEKKDDK